MHALNQMNTPLTPKFQSMSMSPYPLQQMRNLLQGNCETHTNDIEPLLLRYAQECTEFRNEM